MEFAEFGWRDWKASCCEDCSIVGQRFFAYFQSRNKKTVGVSGLSLIERDGCSWLISDDGERMICQNKKLWFETWMVMREEYSRFQSW